ncbi:MAG: two-component regulator propeller domain-containing protein [Bacteroidota bacterium]
MAQKIFSGFVFRTSRFILIFLCTSFAVVAEMASTSLFFKNYSTANGLSNNTVNCLHKDSHGFVWIGTDNGLNRFDGTNFKIFKYNINDPLSLPNNQIFCLLEDGDSNLWVSTNHGLCKYNFKTQTFKRYDLHLPNDSVPKTLGLTRLFLNSKKNFWITTYGYGLLQYDRTHDSLIQFPLPGTIGVKQMYAIAEDNNCNLWICLHYDLLIFNTNSKTYKYQPITVSENGIERHLKLTQIYFDPQDTNHVWIGTWGDGLLYLNTSTFTYESFKFRNGFPHNLSNIVFQLTYCDTDKIWVLNDFPLGVIDTRKHIFSPLSEIEKNAASYPKYITCIYRENKNRTWFGSNQGFSVLDKSQQLFSNIKIKSGKASSEISWDDASQHYYGISLYINRSLFIYNKNFDSSAIYPMPFLDKSTAEPSVVFKNKEDVWIGTQSGGIYFFDETKKNFTAVKTPLDTDAKIKPSVNYIMSDSRGNLWFSCFTNGIMNYNPESKKFEHYPILTETGDTIKQGISKIIELDEEHLAVHFDECGYGIFNKKTRRTKTFFKYDNNFKALSSASDLVKSSDGRLFSITKENGVVEVKDNKCISYNSIGEELIKDAFYSGFVDSLNNIWIGSSNGFYRFSIATKTFSHYSSSFGLNEKVFASELISSGENEIMTLYADGSYYKFNPYKFTEEETSPKLYFVSLTANGISPTGNYNLNDLKQIDLPYDRNNLTVEFAELNFTNPGNAIFEYQLMGSNTRWNVSPKNLMISYSALPPGHYVFNVRCKPIGEIPVSNQISLRVNIIPAYWQTSWFKIMVLILVSGTLFIIFRYIAALRYRQKIAAFERQREIEKVRSRIARDIHDDIGSGITKITLMARNAVKSTNGKKENKGIADKINYAAKELIHQLGEIIWTVNPENDSIQNYFAFVRHYLNGQLEDTPINLKIDIPNLNELQNPDMNLNPDIRRNSMLVLKEAINNALKYAGAKNISVNYYLRNDKLTLEISDDGVGFDNSIQPVARESRTGGNGLKNMSKRAEEMGAALEIISGVGKGTKIILIVTV